MGAKSKDSRQLTSCDSEVLINKSCLQLVSDPEALAVSRGRDAKDQSSPTVS